MKVLSQDNIFRNFSNISISYRNDIIELFFDNGEWLELTSDHKVFCKDGEKKATDIKVGDSVVSQNGYSEVIYKSKHNRETRVFDLTDVQYTHNFFANKVLVSNCDEMAFIEKDVEFWTASYPVIVSGKKTKIIVSSTPNRNEFILQIVDRCHQW